MHFKATNQSIGEEGSVFFEKFCQSRGGYPLFFMPLQQMGIWQIPGENEFRRPCSNLTLIAPPILARVFN